MKLKTDKQQRVSQTKQTYRALIRLRLQNTSTHTTQNQVTEIQWQCRAVQKYDLDEKLIPKSTKIEQFGIELHTEFTFEAP